MPTLSVILPAYNVACYVAEAVKSIQCQTFSDFELLIVDDGSTDQTRGIVSELARNDSRLRVISRPNTGIVGALNDGLALASAPYIARMDGDDIAAPTRFECQLRFLDENPSVVLVGSAVEFIDRKRRRLKTYAPPTDHSAILEGLLAGNAGALIHPAILGRRAVWSQGGGGYREAYRLVEDYDLYLRTLAVGQLANLPDILLRYRIHAASTNYTHRTVQLERKRALMDEAVREHRLAMRRTAVEDTPHADLTAVFREWSWWALEGGEVSTARLYAWQAFIRRPWARENLRCLRASLRSSRLR